MNWIIKIMFFIASTGFSALIQANTLEQCETYAQNQLKTTQELDASFMTPELNASLMIAYDTSKAECEMDDANYFWQMSALVKAANALKYDLEFGYNPLSQTIHNDLYQFRISSSALLEKWKNTDVKTLGVRSAEIYLNRALATTYRIAD